MSARDLEGWMWAEACEALARAEHLQRQFFKLGPPGTARPNWEPPIDLVETASELHIHAALPGVTPDDLRILIDGPILTIAGERRIRPEYRSGAIRRLEIPHGRFERRIELPPGRFERGRRELVDGCLTLTLRKLG